MKINKDILVGTNMLKLCEYWGHLTKYVNELINNYPEYKDDELLALTIEVIDDKIFQTYYVQTENNIDMIELKNNKQGDLYVWNIIENFNFNIESIKNMKYVYDTNYYIKNN